MFDRIYFRSGWRLAVLSAVLNIATHSTQAQDGLVALYTFKEGSGNIVHDVSGVGIALDLEIANPGAVSWLPDGGVSFDAQTIIASSGPATKIIQASQDTDELTVEVWVKPANLIQAGPARLVSVSANPSNRNFTIGQDTDFWIMRVRTPMTGNNGSGGGSQFNTFSGTAETRLTHLVFTRDFLETDTFYVDGVESEIRFDVGGDFSNWNSGYRLGIGGELDNSRQWLGEIHRVAIYNRALTATDVAQTYDQLNLKLDVVDVRPARGIHFHPASSGIRFRAVALRNNTIAQSGVKLILNGEDRSAALQFSGNGTDRQVTFSDLEPNQTYQGEVTITDNQGETRSAALNFQTYTLRPDGLVALYTFEEGNGSTIHDLSEVDPPLDLTIADTSGIRWIPGGGLAIDSQVDIASSEPATKILQPVEQNSAVTIEAWIRSSSDLSGPARIVTMSEFRQNFPGSEIDNSLRNLTLGQEGDSYQVYLRSTDTDEAGKPSLDSPALEVAFPAQVVYTRDSSGQARLYVDGMAVSNQTVAGDLSNWLEGYRLGIGAELNEVTQAPNDHRYRHWEGELYRVAIYHRALTPQEVTESYQGFGISDDQAPPTAPGNLAVTPGAVFARLSWDVSTDDSGRVAYEVERNGEIIASFVSEAGFVDSGVSPSTSYTYRVRAVDYARNSSDSSAAVQVSTGALAEVTGVVQAEFYTDIEGTLVDDLLFEPKFPDDPDFTMFTPALETPSGWGNNYGVRVTGWFVPPQTGQYVFLMASDDEGQFRLSTDATPGNLRWIAQEPQWNDSRDWLGTNRRDGFEPENRSDTFVFTEWSVFDPDTFGALITLNAGQSYYFEALMKEGGGGDHLGVTYKLKGEPDPASGSPSRMTGAVIRSIADPDFVPPIVQTQPQSQAVATGAIITLSVEMTEFSSQPFTYQWRLDGTDIPGATGATHTIPSFQLDNVGDYSVAVNNIAGATTSAAATLGPYGNSLLVLYTFQEGSGTTVRDLSQVGPPLDLEISNAGAVRWLPNGGLAIDSNVLIASPGPASKIIDAGRASGELTVEVWVKPANTTQTGPARLITVSADSGNRNFTLGQDGSVYQFRYRTTATGPNGDSSTGYLTTATEVDTTRSSHIVYTRSQEGQTKIYVDGVFDSELLISGTPASWNENYRLALGNELTSDRSWLGELHRAAIYSYALTAEEIAGQFAAGPDVPAPNVLQPFTLTDVVRTATTFSFGVATQAGQRYTIEFKDDLSQGSWVELRSLTGDGNIQTVTETVATATRFYRVRGE